MRRRTIHLVLTAVVVLTVRTVGQTEVPRVTPTRALVSPRIDGSLDDVAWAEAGVIADIPTPGNHAGRKTSVKLAYDDAHFYVGWICREHEMAKLVTACCSARDKGWGDDSVEVFIQPRPPKGSFFQIIVTVANIVADNRYDEVGRRDPTWDGSVVSSVTRGSDVWHVEMAIPWADLELTPEAGPTMGLHLARWQPIPRGVNSHWGRPGHAKNADPKAFGRMDGVNLDFAMYAVTASAPRLSEGLCFGANRIPVALVNLGARARKLRLEGESICADASPKQVPAVPCRFEIAPGKKMAAALDLTTAQRQGTVCGRLRLVDEETGVVVRRMVRHARVPGKLLQVRPTRRYLYASDETFGVLLHAFIGESSLADHRIRVSHPTAAGTPFVRRATLTEREEVIPIKTSVLPLGDVPITFEVLSAASGEALDRVATKVVRLEGPFDR